MNLIPTETLLWVFAICVAVAIILVVYLSTEDKE